MSCDRVFMSCDRIFMSCNRVVTSFDTILCDMIGYVVLHPSCGKVLTSCDLRSEYLCHVTVLVL